MTDEIAPLWISPAAKEMYEQMQLKMAEAFQMPAYLVNQDAAAVARWHRAQTEATAFLRRQMEELLMQCTSPSRTSDLRKSDN